MTLPPFEPTTFPSTGVVDVDVPSGTTRTIDFSDNPPGNGVYDDIRVRSNATLNFTGGGPFVIERLRVDGNATVNFDAGTYFINRLDVTSDDVTITTNGSVRLYINTRFTTGNNDDNLSVNAGGNVSDLVVFLYPGAEFDMGGDNVTFTGVIYGPQSGEIDFDDDSTITGAIKNQWGCLPKLRHSYHLEVHGALADINRLATPKFAVMDGTGKRQLSPAPGYDVAGRFARRQQVHWRHCELEGGPTLEEQDCEIVRHAEQ